MRQIFFIIALLLSLASNAQFDDEVSSTQLYDKAVDLQTYIQMVGKDKLYILNNLQKKLATKELDYALAKINENINDIDVNATDKKVRVQIRKVKDFWIKFNDLATSSQNIKQYTTFYYQINTFDKLISKLVETMVVSYNISTTDFSNYIQLQSLRAMIQKITISSLASNLGLSKSFIHQYRKNIDEIDALIKKKSNVFLNDDVAGKSFSGIITDWNFFRSNLLHKTIKTPKTIFVLSTSIDYKLAKINKEYITQLNATF